MQLDPFRDRWALVTGASSGIGEALAEALAAAGARLVLTARRVDRLRTLAEALHARHGTIVKCIGADLSDADAPERLWAFTRDQQIEIDILVNNAGLLRYGEFVSSDSKAQREMVQVHCLAMLHLAHLFLPGMVARRSGHVLIVASTTLAPVPYLATYAATKGFDLLFAEGLREEVARHGVNVSALCAGPTESELQLGSGAAVDGEPHTMQPASQVAKRALEGLAAGKPRIHPSWAALVAAWLPRWLPRSTVAGGGERLYRPKSIPDA